jgi:hypothetical protein
MTWPFGDLSLDKERCWEKEATRERFIPSALVSQVDGLAQSAVSLNAREVSKIAKTGRGLLAQLDRIIGAGSNTRGLEDSASRHRDAKLFTVPLGYIA